MRLPTLPARGHRSQTVPAGGAAGRWRECRGGGATVDALSQDAVTFLAPVVVSVGALVAGAPGAPLAVGVVGSGHAVSTNEVRRYACTSSSGTRKDRPTRMAGRSPAWTMR